MYTLNVPLILRLMEVSRETVWCDETFREVTVKNYSFGYVQERLREIDEANVRLHAINKFKALQ